MNNTGTVVMSSILMTLILLVVSAGIAAGGFPPASWPGLLACSVMFIHAFFMLIIALNDGDEDEGGSR